MKRKLYAHLLLTVSAFAVSVQAQDLKYYQVGLQPNGSVVVPTNQIVTPRGQAGKF